MELLFSSLGGRNVREEVGRDVREGKGRSGWGKGGGEREEEREGGRGEGVEGEEEGRVHGIYGLRERGVRQWCIITTAVNRIPC